MKKIILAGMLASCLGVTASSANNLEQAVAKDYDNHLKSLFVHFHKNPELSMAENKTAARMAKELKAAGFEVHTGVGKTGVVAILKNGEGPMVMMRADMDGLPIKEDSGLDYQSTATQQDPFTKKTTPVMHACGHDVHITSLVGTARHMSKHKDQWSGTLMLVVQPAEERIIGARIMREDNIWEKFGTPDFALAFHVSAGLQTGTLDVKEGAASAGSNSIDIIIHGVGTHGAYPHLGKDPIVLGSQIVVALQTLVSRELAPTHDGVVTVGAFNSGHKHNIISDKAHLQLTVRNASVETRDLLINGIKRIAENMGRVAGLPEDKLPEVIVSEEATPPNLNDDGLVQRLRGVWQKAYGEAQVVSTRNSGMGAEDFPFFTTDPYIPSVYWSVGGTPKNDIDAAKNGGPAVSGHHSPFFKVDPNVSVPQGVTSTVLALKELMPKK